MFSAPLSVRGQHVSNAATDGAPVQPLPSGEPRPRIIGQGTRTELIIGLEGEPRDEAGGPNVASVIPQRQVVLYGLDKDSQWDIADQNRGSH